MKILPTLVASLALSFPFQAVQAESLEDFFGPDCVEISDEDDEEVKVKALVDLKFIKNTEITSQVMCFGEDECFTWGTFYLYEAHVRRVIDGYLEEENFRVIFGRHALMEKDFPNVLATLTPLEPGHEEDAKYQALELEWEHGL